MSRGTYAFEVQDGHLASSPANLKNLRDLLSDGRIIGQEWGPGDPGDFDHGAWHILCHLTAGIAVYSLEGRLGWVGVHHDAAQDTYFAGLTLREGSTSATMRLTDPKARAFLSAARLAAFVEGWSQGRISARGVVDDGTHFNGSTRQFFDVMPPSDKNGGTVWEHWVTTRDLRSSIAMSVLSSYLELVALLGGRFVAAVARGRVDHSHPRQLVALVEAGVLTRDDALWDTTPRPIPEVAARLFVESTPERVLEACEQLGLSGDPLCYFMFARKLDQFRSRAAVAGDLEALLPPLARGRRAHTGKLLQGIRVYLSGPMDFVASREDERVNGWRTRIGAVLQDLGCVVFDPWNKPGIRGLDEYGREGLDTAAAREGWSFHDGPGGAKARAKLTSEFWEVLHIDLRMVDTCDFVIAFCPTNIYSVGTPHEIALCRQQRKPVLFVSPPVTFPALEELKLHLKEDERGLDLLAKLEHEVPIKPNPKGIPSLWYMPLVGGEAFFDGFGFLDEECRQAYQWTARSPLDEREERSKPVRPLLPFLHRLSRELPKKWDRGAEGYIANDDWLLWDFPRAGGPTTVSDAHHESKRSAR